jgi:hypothetical protein
VKASSANIDLSSKTYSSGRSKQDEMTESEKRDSEQRSLAAMQARARGAR